MENHIKILVNNSKAFYNYFLEDFTECGIELQGTEIKSLRKNGATMNDAYVLFRNGEAYLLNMHIAPYDQGNLFNHDPNRTRRLLLHKEEIFKLERKSIEKTFVVIPTKVYLKKGKAKVEIALGKSKKKYDKREVIKERDDKRMMDKAKKSAGKDL